MNRKKKHTLKKTERTKNANHMRDIIIIVYELCLWLVCDESLWTTATWRFTVLKSYPLIDNHSNTSKRSLTLSTWFDWLTRTANVPAYAGSSAKLNKCALQKQQQQQHQHQCVYINIYTLRTLCIRNTNIRSILKRRRKKWTTNTNRLFSSSMYTCCFLPH